MSVTAIDTIQNADRDRRPRVLLIAEAANPEWASVPLVGWSLARALSEVADTLIVTQVRNRDAFLRAGLAPDEFVSIDSEAVARPFWAVSSKLRRVGGGWTTGIAFSLPPYWYFERLVWKRFGARIRGGEFDLVHRITPLSPTLPSPLAKRCARAGIPFVLGPLNGGLAWPKDFESARRSEGEWLSYFRAAHRLVPGYESTRAHSAAILVGSEATRSQIPAAHRDRCVYIPENGVDPAKFPGVVARDWSPPLRIAFVGRLVPYKGPDMLIEAAAPLVRKGEVSIDVIGDGPLMASLRRRIDLEGLSPGVVLSGWVEHARVHERLGRAHVLGFPSVREFGGGVVLEAMALGVVPVIVDYGGPGELVTPACGIKIPIGPKASIVRNLREQLERMAKRPESLAPMSEAARRRVLSAFTWQAKARQVLEVYRWVMKRRTDRPDFGSPISDQWDRAVLERESCTASAA